MADGLSRRTVLLGGSLTVVLASAGGAAWWYAGGSSDDPEQRAAATAERVSLVGAAYLAEHPDDADAAELRDALPTLTGAGPDEVVGQLPTIDEAVRADFADDDVVTVSGWMLARTEARAAALVHLLAA